jgi:hypothetical protein
MEGVRKRVLEQRLGEAGGEVFTPKAPAFYPLFASAKKRPAAPPLPPDLTHIILNDNATPPTRARLLKELGVASIPEHAQVRGMQAPPRR